jgi:PAS domain S-box-containing protein
MSKIAKKRGGSEVGRGALETELAEHNRALQALNHLAARLLRIDTTEGIYEVALDGIVAIVGADRGGIALADDANREFRLVAHRNYKASTQRKADHLPYDTPAAHNEARDTGEIVIAHLDNPSRHLREVLAEEGMQTAVLIPLFRGEQVIGVLSYLVEANRDCTPLEKEILRTAATYVGAALERARLYEEAAGERARLAKVLELLPIGVFMAQGEAQGRTVRWTFINKEGQRQLTAPTVTPGVTSEVFTVFRSDGTLYTEDELPIQAALWKGELAEKQEMVFRYHNGEERTFESTIALLSEGKGTREIVEVLQDVTGRRQLEEEVRRQAEALQSENDRLATLVANLNVGLASFDTRGRVTLVNDAWLELTGYRREEVLGYRLDEFGSSPDVETLVKIIDNSLRTGKPFHARSLYVMNARREEGCYTDISLLPIKGEKGKITGLLDISIDVTERHRLDQQKDEFIALASHELRTPVTAIKGYTQIGLRAARGAGDERLVRTLKTIDDMVNRLVRLINELLDISRLDTGTLALHMEAVNLNDLVQRVVSHFQMSTPEFVLDCHLPEEPVTVSADRERIEQVLTNLVHNAIKYSGRARRVEVAVSPGEDGTAVVAVRDYGLGIPVGQQEQVFERFFRASNVASPHYSGLGLGLFLSHNIVTRHGGRMWLESREGEGSTFFFALPFLAG